MTKKKTPYYSILKTVRNFRAYVEYQGLNSLLSKSSPDQIKDIINDYNEFIQAVDGEIRLELKDKNIDEIEELDEKKHLLQHSDEMQEIVGKLEKSLNMKVFW